MGFLKQNKYFDRFTKKHLPVPLSEAKIKGKDTRKKRFILVYFTDEEKEFYMKLLGIDGKKVIYSIEDF